MFEEVQIKPSVEPEEENSKLVKPIAQLLCFIPDAVIETCQKMFVSSDQFKLTDEEIEKEIEKNNEKDEPEEIKYFTIKYSPGIIFSGGVPAFDVDFISPDKSEEKNDYSYTLQQKIDTIYESATPMGSLSEYKKEIELAEKNTNYKTISGTKGNKYKYNLYYNTDEENNNVTVKALFVKFVGDNEYEYLKFEKVYAADDEFLKSSESKYVSTAAVLQSTIATFYNALRRIALVGLLSVLIYIGIRIVLTSTSAKDKAKYKKMLKDWLIAFCILFTLHYIMSITVTVVENICEVIKVSTMGANGEDILMTTLRNKIANAQTWSSVIVQVVIYFVLAIYTIVFTIQYLRRTIYLAFLTIIAPLITFTYPLDKIKDSKSQAFDMWIKDYIFFMLLQVVHLLIYYILVGSSLNLSIQGNWLFAIVAIGFLVPAEKIIKKMFGFEKSKSMGALAAGATGALVMNLINNLSRKSFLKRKYT